MSRVVVRDHHHERRNQSGRRETGDDLRDQHHRDVSGERHHGHRGPEQRDGEAEHASRADHLRDSRAEHDEAGDDERIGHDRGADRGGRRIEARRDAVDRHLQRRHVEDHQHLREADREHRPPGRMQLVSRLRTGDRCGRARGVRVHPVSRLAAGWLCSPAASGTRRGAGPDGPSRLCDRRTTRSFRRYRGAPSGSSS